MPTDFGTTPLPAWSFRPWGTVLLEKPRPSFGGSYIDTRPWGAKEFMQHWELSKQLMERGLERLPDSQAGGRKRG